MIQENMTQTIEEMMNTTSDTAVIRPGMALEMVPPEQTETMSATAAETAEAVIINNSAEKELEAADVKVVGISEEKEADAVSKKDELVEITLSSIVNDEDLNVEYIVKFSKKYMFEGDIINEIDLSGLEDLGFDNLQEIEKIYKKITKSYTSTPDLTDEYALAAAAVVTGLPIEFFTRISLKDIKRIRNRVIGFLYITD